MKIEQKELEPQLLQVSVAVSADDYLEIEKKRTSEVRRNAEFKGFRKGMVPASLIKKMYGEQILGEAVNQVVGEALENYLKEKEYRVMGEPLPSETQPENEWIDGNDFNFNFDVAITPEINIEPSKEDVVTKYNVSATAKEKKDLVERFKKYQEEDMKKAKEEGKEDKVVKTDEEIEKQVEDSLSAQLSSEADWRFNKDVRDYFVKKANLTLPSAFLKRWLIAANKEKLSAEDVEKEYPRFEEDFKWQLVRSYLFGKYKFEFSQDDLKESARAYVRYQYAMYGMQDLPDEILEGSVAEILKSREQVSRLMENVEEQKVLEKLKGEITVKSKKITSEKFREL